MLKKSLMLLFVTYFALNMWFSEQTYSYANNEFPSVSPTIWQTPTPTTTETVIPTNYYPSPTPPVEPSETPFPQSTIPVSITPEPTQYPSPSPTTGVDVCQIFPLVLQKNGMTNQTADLKVSHPELIHLGVVAELILQRNGTTFSYPNPVAIGGGFRTFRVSLYEKPAGKYNATLVIFVNQRINCGQIEIKEPATSSPTS